MNSYELNIGCIDADFNDQGDIFQHFILQEKTQNMPQNPRKCTKPSHQNLDIFENAQNFNEIDFRI